MDEVAVRLLNQESDAWVMVPAQLVGFNMYRLLDFDRPAGIDFEFGPGDLVTTMPLPDDDGKDVLVAHRLFIK